MKIYEDHLFEKIIPTCFSDSTRLFINIPKEEKRTKNNTSLFPVTYLKIKWIKPLYDTGCTRNKKVPLEVCLRDCNS